MHLTSWNRYQAFAAHFGISLVLFFILVALVFGVWYPGILSEADQGWHQALLMIAGVDLVLGPTLTLLVFNPAKKSLKMDLSIIAVVQLAALIAGVYTVHTTRPVALYVAFPPQGYEILYAQTLNSDTLKAIQTSDNQVFYYLPNSGGSIFGPENYQHLTAEELHPITDGGFMDFLHSRAPAGLFEFNDTVRLTIGLTGNWLITDTEGKVLGVKSGQQMQEAATAERDPVSPAVNPPAEQ
ncbi:MULTISPECIES: hypothetical protein [unclassified Oceanobacter]|uniref:hypothetical protein n=1 Tax=unclassified Oceanobacter TaxID=2620260 RepID=UPI0026E2251A|nr:MULTISPECIES: hypothetical protein [unclassified Oceanobacter]MDO6681762.1 hypothetical protein [Oceanobacter sp. 5_MG-2023]MDP2506227.1 hypothetical protein [Oceanobacter sp. 3_MG-2023]MDP2546511.1 hypothetical protein [Oceanobacter sp. 4_MG-2023]MDP2609701.1 hypothetical protein [Oceanobacter sp. 1_MG-2023]MDP2613854.1 hypothetical protein [Oceanobacter sp. 2_MG-2023]